MDSTVPGVTAWAATASARASIGVGRNAVGAPAAEDVVVGLWPCVARELPLTELPLAGRFESDGIETASVGAPAGATWVFRPGAVAAAIALKALEDTLPAPPGPAAGAEATVPGVSASAAGAAEGLWPERTDWKSGSRPSLGVTQAALGAVPGTVAADGAVDTGRTGAALMKATGMADE
jgi:hypothetical protein